MDTLKAEPDMQPREVVPERSFVSAIINCAFEDACRAGSTFEERAWAEDGMDFLMSHRSDPYFELIGIEPEAAKESLIRSTQDFPKLMVFRNRLRKWRADNARRAG